LDEIAVGEFVDRRHDVADVDAAAATKRGLTGRAELVERCQ
jgi:hypothetical protein